ncbi:MAG: DUF2946 family protein [Pseudomonadota bacterium]
MKQSLHSSSILTRLRSKSQPRFAVVLLALLGFLLQSHVAQTHIHVDCAQAQTQQTDACAGNAAGDGSARQTGSGDNSGGCALCQIAAHGGAAPLPALVLAFAQPRVTHVTPADQAPASAVSAISHSWQSRAPPIG